ncbi:LCP family protein [Nocardia sp. NEAU-G5]|uniref:LCP family protein n=1 Tax=Nocardia albiluteola TaxID=2842303 RepID=A0ABS6B0E9_9NOCA|nr:LCP family protein [Nocardia albiluteola]MBU3062936.1 LCP family protein [Nocardia albiluteola]
MSYGGERRPRGAADPKTERLPHGTQPRRRTHRQPPRRARQSSKGVVAGRSIMAVVSAAVLVGTGAAYRVYDHAVHSVTTSDAISDGPKSSGQDQNILIMGLDSRLDEHGNALPQAMYNALHAGDDSNGGMNSNVLIMIHIPGDGSKATAISIPRDDYASLDPTACGGETCKGKIKEAYGRAYGASHDKYASKIKDPVALDAKSRDAGRKAEVNTVSKFLGNVPIDHFVEITLAAFFQVAEAVQPITVCLNEKTSDNFSGAKFAKGPQQINASQAMAFVRQRRDPNESLNFTDLDRTRRQQAFIVSLLHQLQSSGTMSSPSKLMSLLGVAQQNMAVDSGLDLGKFAAQASSLMSGGLSLFTLPVKDFGNDPSNGEDINLVDVDVIQSIVHNLLNPPKPGASTSAAAPTTTSTNIPSAQGIVVNVVNGSGHNGLGGDLEKALAARGFTQGQASTGSARSGSTLLYGSGAATAANALASQLGLTATASSSLDSNSIQVTVGTESASSGPIASIVSAMGGSDSATTTTPPPPPPVSATAVGQNSPAPTDLSSMQGSGIPCVK